MSARPLLEVCVGDADSLAAAVEARPDRIELCCALEAGGLTPSEPMVRLAVSTGLKVNVLVRPRSGDFLYSDTEARLMADDILMCRDAGANGVVVGALLPDGSVDMRRMALWRKCAGQMRLTFHRALDMCADPFAAIDLLDGIADTVLTSGLAPTAWHGREMLRRLNAYAAGRLTVMAGGGVSPANIRALADATGAGALHGTFSAPLPSAMAFRRSDVSMSSGGADEFSRRVTSATLVKQALESLR